VIIALLGLVIVALTWYLHFTLITDHYGTALSFTDQYCPKSIPGSRSVKRGAVKRVRTNLHGLNTFPGKAVIMQLPCEGQIELMVIQKCCRFWQSLELIFHSFHIQDLRHKLNIPCHRRLFYLSRLYYYAVICYKSLLPLSLPV